jgi:hypothetical protein
MKHLMEQDRIESLQCIAGGERQAVGVGEPHLCVLNMGAGEPVARNGKHFRADIDADGALYVRGQQLEHAPRAGSGVEQIIHRHAYDVTDDGRLNILVRRMQCADAFPFGGIGLEIGGRLGGAGLAHGCQPFEIGIEYG